ncbi:MAG: aquaporin [Bacilli bacterium]|nr:aquaporin [Bacilli bacterium]
MRKYIAEFIGTLILVLFGTGIAAFSGGDLVATALAFGLAIIATAYVIGNISGCHVNPAVSLAMFLKGEIDLFELIGYIISQVLGALAGSGILYAILAATNLSTNALGANGYGALSATNISLWGAIITEIVLTAVFVYTILGVTSDSKKSSVAGIVIGLTLTFVHLLGINLTGTSVNPARSLAPALILGGKALSQVWVFIVAPMIGAVVASFVYNFINKN